MQLALPLPPCLAATLIVASTTVVNITGPIGGTRDNTPAVTGTVQNTIIFARIDSIDGPGSPGVGNILGQASPCYVNGNAIPFLGFMEFDSLDVSQLVARGQFEKVVLHEIGHVLGIGTVWNFQRSLLNTSITGDPYYVGSGARAQFAAINTVTYSGNPVPVEMGDSTAAAGDFAVAASQDGWAVVGGQTPQLVALSATLSKRGEQVSTGGATVQRLLAAVEAHAIGLNCCKLTLEVLEGNTIAQSAYRSLGFDGYQLDPSLGKALFWEKKLA